MKPIALIAAPLVAVLVTALSAAPARLPTGWMRAGDAGDCQMSSAAPADDGEDTALALDCPPGTQGFATIMQQMSAQGYAGRRLRWSASVQGEALQNWGGLWMRGDAGSRSSRAFDNMQLRPLTGSFAWRRAEVVLQIPADVDTLSFGLLLEGGGSLRARGIKLEIVPESVPLTQPQQDAGARP